MSRFASETGGRSGYQLDSTQPTKGLPLMTMTLQRSTTLSDFRDLVFEEELVLQMRLAELVIALSGCSARRAFRLVRRRYDETPPERLARAFAITCSEIAAA